MKTLPQLIEEGKKALAESKFGKGGGACFECSDYEGMYSDLEFFLESFALKIAESAKEETVGPEDKTPLEPGVINFNLPNIYRSQSLRRWEGFLQGKKTL